MILLNLLIFVAIFIGVYIWKLDDLRSKIQTKSGLKKNKKAKKEDITSKNINRFNQFLKKKNSGYFSYERIEKYLKKNGNPLKLSPGGFLICKMLISIIIFIIFSSNVIFALLLSVLGFYLIDFIIYESNKSDMKKIRIQLVNIYDFLSIQTAAGVFVGNALTESYLMAENKRLKTALAELCAEINLTKDVEGALDKFGECFNSIEIDSFILVVKQSLKTGKIQKALEDLSSSQKDANLVLIQEHTDKINIVKDIIQMMMYFGILALIMFGLFMEIRFQLSGLF